ncbi:unannotated protein [freshwater metagenome]|uniref:Unannotated protein n=1 Tax=freshwater metagenome TaxID=449393 RepID=A0A6J7SL78_9ZZZZ
MVLVLLEECMVTMLLTITLLVNFTIVYLDYVLENLRITHNILLVDNKLIKKII